MKYSRFLLLFALLIFATLLLVSCVTGNVSGTTDNVGGGNTQKPSDTTDTKDPTPCTDHTWGDDYVVVIQATCSYEGELMRFCSVCRATKNESIPKTEHTHSDEWNSNAQYHWYTPTCHCQYASGAKVNKGEHEWDEGTLEIEPTCHTYGRFAYRCTVCQYAKFEDVPMLEHTYSDEWTSNDQYHWHDNTCGCPKSQRIDSAAHTWDDGVVITQPNCLDRGTALYTCTVCFAEKEDYIPTNDEHSWTDEVTAPTCITRGYTTHTCSRCNLTNKDTYTDTIDHDYVPTVVAPSCSAEGYTAHTCTMCKDSYKDSYTDMVDHVLKTQTVNPTCKYQGYVRHYCINCTYAYKTDYTDVLPHTYESAVTDPTCAAKGYTTYTCVKCKYVYKDNYTEKTPHNYDVETILPTCTSYGYSIYTCQDCGYYYNGSYTDILPHEYEKTVTPPTCIAIGYTYYDCIHCPDWDIRDKVPELGHTYENLLCIRCSLKEYSFDLKFTLSGDEAYYIVSGIGKCTDKNIIIPHTHEGLPVKEIAASAFEGNTKITSLTFMSGDVDLTIGNLAFFGCTSLTSVKFGTGLASVGTKAFGHCEALERISIDSPNESYYSVGNCLIEIKTGFVVLGCNTSVIPDDGKVLGIESYAFYGCAGLTHITIPASVYFIGNYAFSECESLATAQFMRCGEWEATKTRSHALSREYSMVNQDFYGASERDWGYNARVLTDSQWYYYTMVEEEEA